MRSPEDFDGIVVQYVENAGQALRWSVSRNLTMNVRMHEHCHKAKGNGAVFPLVFLPYWCLPQWNWLRKGNHKRPRLPLCNPRPYPMQIQLQPSSDFRAVLSKLGSPWNCLEKDPDSSLQSRKESGFMVWKEAILPFTQTEAGRFIRGTEILERRKFSDTFAPERDITSPPPLVFDSRHIICTIFGCNISLLSVWSHQKKREKRAINLKQRQFMNAPLRDIKCEMDWSFENMLFFPRCTQEK